MSTGLWVLNKESRKSKKVSKKKETKREDKTLSVVKVQEFLSINKERTFTNKELAEELNISLGSVSGITKRLQTVSDIKIVAIRDTGSGCISKVYQHKDGSRLPIPLECLNMDAITKVLNKFKENPNAEYSRNNLKIALGISESAISTSLQILLLNREIKLVTLKNCASYQYKEGNKKGLQINVVEDENYMQLSKYIEKNNLKEIKDKLIDNLDENKARLLYSSHGYIKVFPISELEKAKDKVFGIGGIILNKIFKGRK